VRLFEISVLTAYTQKTDNSTYMVFALKAFYLQIYFTFGRAHFCLYHLNRFSFHIVIKKS